MIQPQLSILIPAIPSRWESSTKLYGQLLSMAEGKNIEIIMLADNYIMSIGQKHNVLKNACNGKFFQFIHDDDSLESLEEIYEATFQNVDVIDFKALCKNADGSNYIVTQQLGNPVEHNSKDGRYLDMRRPPFPNCCWNEKFKKFDFADIGYAEDWSFVEQCLKEAKTEVFIDKILFKYNFDPKVSAAPVESNSHWTNPNESHS